MKTTWKILLGALWLIVSCKVFAWDPVVSKTEYQNPVIYADYSDPDVIRVDDAFYLVSSSFNVMPGIPVLKSYDLLNWQIIGHVYSSLPLQKYDKPAHGQGSWAPAIRFHDGLFYVYFCTPHDGLFVATSKDPAGKWDLQQMESVELWEDPAPFWDDDGQAYLVRSKVRADNLYLHRMSSDGKTLLDDGKLIYRDLDKQPVIEGPKLYKMDGWYYIFAPAGGVSNGWQTVLRSRNIYGPYEAKTVMHQGPTQVNGPHQGGLVQAPDKSWWFLHFQEKSYFGRIVHMQPVEWVDGWPKVGIDVNRDQVGEPVSKWLRPPIKIGKDKETLSLQASDEFRGRQLGLQWQWHANPQPDWFRLKRGRLRLNAMKNPSQNGNLYFVPNLLLQKVSGPTMEATTKFRFSPSLHGDKAGLVVMGRQWGYVAVYQEGDTQKIGVFSGRYEQYDDATRIESSLDIPQDQVNKPIYFKVRINSQGGYQFSVSFDEQSYTQLGPVMQAEPGVWIGAKVGLFALNPSLQPSEGYAEFDWFRVE